jgi:hypothetical protein
VSTIYRFAKHHELFNLSRQVLIALKAEHRFFTPSNLTFNGFTRVLEHFPHLSYPVYTHRPVVKALRHFCNCLSLLRVNPPIPKKFLLVSHIHNLISSTPLVCASPLDRWQRFTPHFYSLSSFSVCEQLVLARHGLDYGTLIDSHRYAH